ncbi:MAG: deoxyuridine 5'-triphosphate nucleotidohydrolase [Blautia sp.]|uniref:deoxyuridine 5'-triphosphate nucleotidohydrolase n=1 Tax=Blautia sp. TaxID=1955243 RepID=UPI0025C22EC3|nr:deoxyuridine 5'-triphosphate nucleotidohydrolase [Blautia sp.]MCI6304632.1 deoxyuridine 5'-triphosphate nucleotidohydrolase [Blautia sp.]
MKRIAKFEKVSLEEFMKDWCDTFELDSSDPETRREIEGIYGGIELPKRATKFSAGHDFVSPLTFTLKPNDTIKIPTGIRCGIDIDWVLMIYPRSGLGFKYGINLMNQTAVVDADYYYSNNEGHIFIKLVNRGDKIVTVKRDDKFTQGVFLPYGITEDDNVNDKRNGGLGSTGN